MVTFWNSSLCTRDAAVVNQAVIKTDATICFHDTRSVPRVSIGFGEILCPDEKFKAVTKGTISPCKLRDGAIHLVACLRALLSST